MRGYVTAFIITCIVLYLHSIKAFNKIEAFLSKTSPRVAAGVSITLISICLLFFMLTDMRVLIFRSYNISAILIVMSYLAALSSLLTKTVDRFRYAILFMFINLISFFGLFCFSENLPERISPYIFIDVLSVILFCITPFICLLLFFMQSTKTEPANRFFKLVRKIGAKDGKDRAQAEKYAKNKTIAPKEFVKRKKMLEIFSIAFLFIIIIWSILPGYISSITVAMSRIGLVVLLMVAGPILYYLYNKKY